MKWLVLIVALGAAFPSKAELPMKRDITLETEDLYCMAFAVHYEAGVGTDRAMINVAHTILNRLDAGWPLNKSLPKTVCGVVTDGLYVNGRLVRCAFETACDGRRDDITNRFSRERAFMIARRVMNYRDAYHNNGGLFFIAVPPHLYGDGLCVSEFDGFHVHFKEC